jgi:uncharacterized membrane protein YeaQ/YmgE (transglycosylase-associated protein family)
MPLLALVALVLLILFALLIWITGTLIGLALHLLMAGVIGWLADTLVPGRVPYGFLGLILAGLVGSWLGQLLLGRVGPTLVIFGIDLIPALIGTVIVVAIAALLTRSGVAAQGNRL